MDRMYFVLIISLLCGASFSEEDTKLLIYIRGQTDSYHRSQSDALQENIYEQISSLLTENVHVKQLAAEIPVEESWAILPIIPVIANKHADNYNWVMFIEEWTKLDVGKLLKFLRARDSTNEELLAHALTDKEPVIIHHFDYDEDDLLEYPDLDAGWIMSSALLKKFGRHLEEAEDSPDFQIDVKHELAKNLKDSLDITMTHCDEFCNAGETPTSNSNCMTWVNTEFNSKCGNNIGVNDVLFGIKTTKMFHKSRVMVVEQTWGALPIKKIYYSNETDPEVPAAVDCGVPNTERGHCGKTDAILKDFVNNRKEPWLVVADDDSIIGIASMIQLLNCYDHTVPVLLGERYGYGLNKRHGYSYITGGGGMIFSRPAAKVWVDECACPADNTPDDMFISQCVYYKKGVKSTHSPTFHQARPEDYSNKYIANHKPVSFHKHWNNDPVEVYNEYFSSDDNLWLANLYKSGVIKQSEKSILETTPTPPPDIIPEPLPPTPTEDAHDEL